jgi:Putative adhesin
MSTMNRRALLFLTSAFAAVAFAAVPATTWAQRAAQTNDDWCRTENWEDRRPTFCEVREFTVPAAGLLTVDAEPNGGIDVSGTTRGDVLVRAKVSATAETMERAQQIARSVTVSATASNVAATGPSGLERRAQWTVSYRLSVPTVSSLSLKTTNGGIAIRDVDGEVEFRTVNGGVKLANMAGDVKGRTSNGGVDVDLDGPSWRGAGLNVETSNGGVHLRIPSQYSAQLETGTVNGGFNIDFPLTVQGRIDREINATLGSGGAPIRVRTNNGGVKVSKKEQ